MMDAFKNILIPIDFSVNTEVAVKKAMETADKNATLHLFHVKKWQWLKLGGLIGRKIGVEKNHITIEKKLAEWKWTIEDYSENIQVKIWVFDGGTVQKGIEKKAVQLNADLIILGKNERLKKIPAFNDVCPNKIAINTGIPVLNVKHQSLHSRIRRVILPIVFQPNFEKMEAISVLCRKYQAKIYLVTFNAESKDASEQNISSLLKVYQSLRTMVNCEVEYGILSGQNTVKALSNFALQINADILFFV